MATSVAFGIPGLSVDEGDHICAFYRGLAERDALLLPYLTEGLRAGDKCICVVDATDPEAVLLGLGGELDIRTSVARRQMEVMSSRDAYLVGGGFSTPRMLTFWEKAVGAAIGDEGYAFSRAVGEMTWALRDVPGVEELVGYESELNRFLVRYPQVILCLYDLERFTGDVLVDVLKTHPKIMVGGTVLENPYYLEPDEFLAARR